MDHSLANKERALRTLKALPPPGNTIGLKKVKTHPTFVDLLPVSLDLLENLIQGMRADGYYESEPIVLGTWPGQAEPVLIDGHMRMRAALEVGITEVPFVVKEFPDEAAAVSHAISLQTKRRTTTDAALYRLCGQYDRLMARGGDRRSEEAKSKMTRVSNDRARSASARMTAQLIGCNYKKVDKIRKIRRDGTPQIQEDVSNDRMSINKAYKLIRDIELGREDNGERVSRAHMKAAKTLFTEENFAALQELDGNLCSLVNAAVEQFINGSGKRGILKQIGCPRFHRFPKGQVFT